MSELINTNDNRATIRWKLMAGVSALALAVYVSSTGLARAEDSDHPTLWLEFGGQVSLVQGTSSHFTAPFMTAITPTPMPYLNNIFAKGQRPPRFDFGGEGKISFQPEDSDWVFSAGIRYGRARDSRHIHHQSPDVIGTYNGHPRDVKAAPFVDTTELGGEHHTIVDFSAGKDVGLGKFGHDGTSNFSVGVRFAQFTGSSIATITARPTVHLRKVARAEIPTFYNYTMFAHGDRDFHGVGPSLSWNASAALAGNKQNGELTLDWGIDGAVLFGRQRVKTAQTTQAYVLPFTPYPIYVGYYYGKAYQHGPRHTTRSRSVTVPNIGGFAGLSWKTEHAKVSFGYRYDTFLGAMDTGIDKTKKSNATFDGPFASISIGLGD